MARLTIAALNEGYPLFRVSVRVVSGRRYYHADHGPSRLGTASIVTDLTTMERVLLSFDRDRDNRSCWRAECFLGSVDFPAGEVAP